VLQFGRAGGESAMQAEWLALRMGMRNADGSKTGGKATFGVKDYTTQFVRFMRALLPGHTLLTTDLLVKDRYLGGIKAGWLELYKTMLGNAKVLRYQTLADAIEDAERAEGDLSVAAKSFSHQAPSTSGGNSRGFFRSQRHATEVSNLEGSGSDEPGRDSPDSPSSTPGSQREGRQLNGFVYRPNSSGGRHPLTEPEAKMLFNARRCYTCYKEHAKFGGCKDVQKVAPRPLKA
jgi:hypothetical protein